MTFSDYLIPIETTEDTETIDYPCKKENNAGGILRRIKAKNSLIDAEGHFDIQQYFHLRGWHISAFGDCEENAWIAEFAEEMALAYHECHTFYKFLRSTITKKQFQFIYSLTDHSEDEKNSIIHIATRMYAYGMFINFTVKNNESIYARISNAPKVVNFINGKYAEIFAVKRTLDVLHEIHEYHNCEYDVFPNTHIVSYGKEHELDIVFYFDEIVFWVEVKSGDFSDYNHYRELGIEIGVNPNRHLLLSVEISDEDTTDAVGWFFDCFVANIKNYDKKLQQMIEYGLIDEGRI